MSDAVVSIAVVSSNTGSDQREDAFRIGLTAHQIRDAELREPRVDPVEAFDNAVVREDPAVLQERVGVADFQCGAGRVADMRHERRPGQLVRLGCECAVLPRRHRSLVDDGLTVGLEHPDPGAVGIAPALLDEIVGRVEQPKGRGDHPAVGVQTEKSTHGAMVAWRDGRHHAGRALLCRLENHCGGRCSDTRAGAR
jgi:hypothetical protein